MRQPNTGGGSAFSTWGAGGKRLDCTRARGSSGRSPLCSSGGTRRQPSAPRGAAPAPSAVPAPAPHRVDAVWGAVGRGGARVRRVRLLLPPVDGRVCAAQQAAQLLHGALRLGREEGGHLAGRGGWAKTGAFSQGRCGWEGGAARGLVPVRAPPACSSSPGARPPRAASSAAAPSPPSSPAGRRRGGAPCPVPPGAAPTRSRWCA